MRRFGTGDGRVAITELRRLLIEQAERRETITYGEVAEAFGERWQQGFGASLKKALNELGAQNKARGEPLLMALVVNRDTQEPGEGFYKEISVRRGALARPDHPRRQAGGLPQGLSRGRRFRRGDALAAARGDDRRNRRPG